MRKTARWRCWQAMMQTSWEMEGEGGSQFFSNFYDANILENGREGWLPVLFQLMMETSCCSRRRFERLALILCSICTKLMKKEMLKKNQNSNTKPTSQTVLADSFCSWIATERWSWWYWPGNRVMAETSYRNLHTDIRDILQRTVEAHLLI